jgi:alcohol dehydrogenase
MINGFQFFIPTQIYFGAGKLSLLSSLKLPGTKALIVTTSGGSLKRNGVLDRIRALLLANHVESVVFNQVTANPTTTQIAAGADMARINQSDFVLGVGGGSALDAAKAIAVLARNPGNFWDYIQRGSGGRKKPSQGALPVVAIATTAGTGTEADPWLVVSNPVTDEKIGCGWDFTFPTISIIDPELMLSVPPDYTAFQGMDAFFHAVEGYIATCATEVSDLFALQTVSLIAKSLPEAVRDGGNLSARADVAWASTSAGIVETLSDTVSQHYISHAISAFYPAVPHGAALISICIEYFTRMKSAVPDRLSKLAAAMGVDGGEKSPEKGADCFIVALCELIDKVGMGKLDLKTYGVDIEKAAAISAKAFDTDGHLFEITPVQLSREEVADIVRKSIAKC